MQSFSTVTAATEKQRLYAITSPTRRILFFTKVYNFIWYTPRNTPDFDELVELIYEDVKKLPYETLKRNADGGDYDSILQLAMRYVPKSESQARLADSYIDLTPAVACPKAPMDPLTS